MALLESKLTFWDSIDYLMAVTTISSFGQGVC